MGPLKLNATDLEITTHYTHGLHWPNLLELLTGCSLIARKMMDRTGCPAASRGKIRAALSSGLENESLRIIRIESAIWQYRSRVDYENIQ